MYLKIHALREGRILAACDRELLGKVIDDGRIRLDLLAYRSFYEGELVSESGLREALSSKFSSANLVGERAVATAINAGMAGSSDVIYINKTPHIQLYNI